MPIVCTVSYYVSLNVLLKNIITDFNTTDNSLKHYGVSTEYDKNNKRRQTCVVKCT